VEKTLKLNRNGLITNELSAIYQHLAEDYVLYTAIALLTALSTLFIFAAGYSSSFAPFAYFKQLKIILPLSLIAYLGFCFVSLLIKREARPLLYIWRQIECVFAHRARIISALCLLTAISIFSSNFSTVKALIPLIHPFEYDGLFHDIDLQLFGGIEPWALVHSLAPTPYFTLVINTLYNIWFFLIWAVLCYFTLCSDRKKTLQFILSWLISWTIIGNALALVMSSAGPAFVAKLDPSNLIYQDLMGLLNEQNLWLRENDLFGVWALNTQGMLWDAYATGKEMLGSGISAMPSMHVAMAVLMALSAQQINSKLGSAMWLYALAIYIGSFALGWHYAIDGLVSAPITILIWFAVGKLTQRLNSKQIA